MKVLLYPDGVVTKTTMEEKESLESSWDSRIIFSLQVTSQVILKFVLNLSLCSREEI